MGPEKREPSSKRQSSRTEGAGGRLKEGDYSATIEKYEALIKSGKTDVETWVRLGNAYNASGAHDEAIKCYDKALLISSGKEQEFFVLVDLADAYAKVGDFEKEEETYAALLKKAPENRFIWGKAGRAFERLGRFQEATLYYTRATQLNPNDPELFYNYAFFCEKLGQPNNAIAALERALTLKPDSERILEKLAIMYSTVGKYEGAIKCRTRMLELDEDNVEKWEDLALVYAVARYHKQAIEICRKGIVKFNSASLWYMLGDIFIDLDKASNALYCYDAAVALGHHDAKKKAENLRSKNITPKGIGLPERA